MEAFVQHWFEMHTARKYACQLCGSIELRRKLEEGAPPDNDVAVRLNGLVYDFTDLASVCAHLQDRHSLSSTSAPTFTQVAYKCSECPFVSSVPVEFADHFSSTHSLCDTTRTSTAQQSSHSPCESRCFYRCFGECKKLLHSIGELRGHMRTCPSAVTVLKRVIGEQLLNIPKTVSTVADSRRSDAGVSPLCFCLYCDISMRKNDSTIGAASEACEENSANASSIASAPVAFRDLNDLHAHEHSTHLTGGAASSSVIVGCPWCGESLTLIPNLGVSSVPIGAQATAAAPLKQTSDLINHLRAHAAANPYIAWQIDRLRRFEEKGDDVIICRCQTGLLDSPLALMSHASAFPTATNTFKGSRKRHFGGANLLPFPSLFATPNILTPRTTTASRGNIPPRGESGIENAISTTQPLYMPGGHPPLSAEVYEHLRFGEHYDLDQRLMAFHLTLNESDDDTSVEEAAKRAFCCPICNSYMDSRWGLTEHAFVSHWLRLCYVCCDHIHRDGDREQSIWLHILDCLRQRHKALRQAQVVNTAHSDVLVNATDRNEDCDDASEQSTIQQPSHRQTRLGNRLRQEAAQGADVMSQPASDTRSPSPPCLAANDLEDGRFADPPSVGVALIETAVTGREERTCWGSHGESESATHSLPPQLEPVVGRKKSQRLAK